jgi:hypothetical protein
MQSGTREYKNYSKNRKVNTCGNHIITDENAEVY